MVWLLMLLCRRRATLLAVLWLGAAQCAMAQAVDAPPRPANAAPPGRIEVLNRDIATLSSSVLGLTPAQRAAAAKTRIKHVLRDIGSPVVSTQTRAEGTAVLMDGKVMFMIGEADAAERTAVSAKADALQAAAVLQQVIEESTEARNTAGLLRAAGVVALASAVLGLLFWGLRKLSRFAERWLVAKTEANAARLRIGGVEVVRHDWLVRTERLLLRAAFWLGVALLLYEWLSIAFAQFPYTRVWSEQLNAFLFGLLSRFALAIVHAVPDVIAAALIFLLAYLFGKLVRGFFANVQAGRITLTWLDADVALLTSRICTTAIWLFALAMAYPYLPGSQTDAFKGVSVLLGLMISLGASNLVGQMASGMILTYTHAYRNGEYVRIAEHEGTVMGLGTFTTRIRTGLGEELTISNSQVLGAVTKNYSRASMAGGFIVDATVTIGYDTPWRQVSALLVQAALRTPGIVAEPAPRVFQTALSDFYPEYRLVCHATPSEPRPRAVVMSDLHANIQDLFNEYGVQIMSPHYLGDPANAKVVAANRQYAAPAKPPTGA